MDIKILKEEFSICKVADFSEVNFNNEYVFAGNTDEEKSLVCRTCDAPANITDRDDNWRCLRLQGVLNFSLIGIIAKISNLFAENGIGIFVISTYNTDYILTKRENFKKAVEILTRNNYKIIE